MTVRIETTPPVIARYDGATDRLRVISGDLDRAGAAQVLLVDRDRPLGFEAWSGPPSADATRALRRWCREAVEDLRAEPRSAPDLGDDAVEVEVTAVLCTLGRHPRLAESVRALLSQTYAHYRVLVVDNDPASGATQEALADLRDARLALVEEPRRGLSYARNRGLRTATTEVIAFTDDDAIAEPTWLEHLMRTYVLHPEVAVVTGLVLPAELRTPAQRHFEGRGGFGKGFTAQWWALDPPEGIDVLGEPGPRSPLFPVTTGRLGSGNSMAFRRSSLARLGGFDPALGAGTPAQGGEDLDAFSQMLQAGFVVAYTPASVVWHYHRETLPALKSQLRATGVGMGAVILKGLGRSPGLFPRILAAIPRVARQALSRDSARRRGGTTTQNPREARLNRALIAEELLGLLQSPLRYPMSRRAVRR